MKRQILNRTASALSVALAMLCVAMPAHSAQKSAQVTAELIPETSRLVAGQVNWFALRLAPDPGWHSYWINPGDAGLPTRLRWDLPDGVVVGEPRWPFPESHREGPLVTYGYGHEHVVLTPITVPSNLASEKLPVKLTASWLACEKVCIPGKAEFELVLPVGVEPGAASDSRLFAHARSAIPADATQWGGAFAVSDEGVRARFDVPAGYRDGVESAEFFPYQPSMIDHAARPSWSRTESALIWAVPRGGDFAGWPERLAGVLVLHRAAGATAYAVDVAAGTVPVNAPSWVPDQTDNSLGWVWAILLAMAGGLILNLMPCVFPVLALKALSLAGAEQAAQRRAESLTYAAGVVLSFLLVASVLLALRAGGAALGWGFQLQNPLIVGGLAYLMLLVGLGLAGWTELGQSFMGLGDSATRHAGHRGAFFTGALAVVVASPCTAPFMGAALGYAVTQPAVIALSIFLSLGIGMALPFVIIAWVPALAQRLPRPGAWMNTFKLVLAWPMLLTAAWLFWVLYRQTDLLTLLVVVGGAAVLAVAIRHTPTGRWVAPRWGTALMMVSVAALAWPAWGPTPTQAPRQMAESGLWQNWSPERLDEMRQQGRPVFVNFTADWCLSCLVNEKAAFASADVARVVDSHGVVLLKADWTNYDARITAALEKFGRNGVPLYLFYPPGASEPQLLPQLLTPSIVSDAIENAMRAAATGAESG